MSFRQRKKERFLEGKAFREDKLRKIANQIIKLQKLYDKEEKSYLEYCRDEETVLKLSYFEEKNK